MKRPVSKKRSELLSGDIERDLTVNQLAKVGAISFAYNKAESKIDVLFSVVTELDGQMLLEVSTRINGLDGKIAVIVQGSKGIGLSDANQRAIEETLGENVFQRLKKYREAVIHARIVSAPHAIGQTIERRAKINEVLLSQDALDTLYLHLKALDDELHQAWAVILISRMLKGKPSDYKHRGLLEEELRAESDQYQEIRKRRLSLPPIPEFPPESQFREATIQWTKDRLSEAMEKFTQQSSPR